MLIQTNHKFLIFLIAVVLITLLFIPSIWPTMKIQAYKIIRNLSQFHLALVTKDYSVITDKNFIVKYKLDNEESARLVLENGNEIMGQVNRILDYSNQAPVPVIVYPSMVELNKSFGWDGDRSPMGVYWMGSIRILAPEAWIDEGENKALMFKNLGPMAHEYAHLVVDYKTNGNYTRWFTEGIAQYVEREITGFTLDEPTEEAKKNLYSFKDLDVTFDAQENQDLAYWQSLVAVDYLIETKGEEIIKEMLAKLNQGQDFDRVFQDTVGQDLATFEKNIRAYAKNK